MSLWCCVPGSQRLDVLLWNHDFRSLPIGILCVVMNYAFFVFSHHLSAEDNQAIYSKCNNPHGHGHNYKGNDDGSCSYIVRSCYLASNLQRDELELEILFSVEVQIKGTVSCSWFAFSILNLIVITVKFYSMYVFSTVLTVRFQVDPITGMTMNISDLKQYMQVRKQQSHTIPNHKDFRSVNRNLTVYVNLSFIIMINILSLYHAWYNQLPDCTW